MRVLNSDNEVLLFWGTSIKVWITNDLSRRIEDEDGNDISRAVCDLSVVQDMGRAFAQLRLNSTPGFDGMFCVPQVGFSKLLS